jgi:hypothetical protein
MALSRLQIKMVNVIGGKPRITSRMDMEQVSLTMDRASLENS